MSRLRIAQNGWHHSRPADSEDEVLAGVKLPWIEIDGHRITNVQSATFRASDDDITMPEVTIRLFGSVEIVYLDGFGNELTQRSVDPRELEDEVFDSQSVKEVPAANPDLDELVRQRDYALKELRRWQDGLYKGVRTGEAIGLVDVDVMPAETAEIE